MCIKKFICRRPVESSTVYSMGTPSAPMTGKDFGISQVHDGVVMTDGFHFSSFFAAVESSFFLDN